MELKRKQGRPKTRSKEELVEARKERSRRYEAKLRKYVWDYKCNRSCKCGQSHPAALQFHHRDPSTKKFDVAKSHKAKSVKRIQEEIDKCDIICANCHAILHHEQRQTNKN